MTQYEGATGTWELDSTHTNIGFSARHAMVAKVRGRFTEYAGTIVIDGANPSASSTKVTIQTKSIDTRNDQRDEHLRSADFLDVEQFPEVTFASTGVKDKGDGEFVLAGDLTIHGVTRPVELEVSYAGVSPDPWGGTRIGFEAHTEISRKDFGLTWNVALETGGVLVSDKIRIDIDVEAVKQEAAAE